MQLYVIVVFMEGVLVLTSVHATFYILVQTVAYVSCFSNLLLFFFFACLDFSLAFKFSFVSTVKCIPPCQNGGSCVFGHCNCMEGYGGNHCELQYEY